MVFKRQEERHRPDCRRPASIAFVGVLTLGERHFRRTIAEFVAHYHGERNHQGIGNELIQPLARADEHGPVRRRERIGGLLNYYCRAA